MDSKIVIVSIAAVIGIIVLGGVLMPVLEDSRENIGTEASVTNPKYSGANYSYSIWDGSDIVFEYESTDDSATYTINGETFTLLSSEQRIILASNDFAARTGGNDTVYVLNAQYVGVTTQFNNTDFTYTIADKQYTLDIGGQSYTGSVDWLVFASAEGNTNLIQMKDPATTPFYLSNKNDMIVLGNIYTTGDNDTFYSYYNGDLTVNETYADVSSVTINKTLVDGYTDIYSTTLTVNVGDESFTPFFILVPETVNGHEASGASYNLLGVIPVLIIVAILMGVVALIFKSRIE